MGSVVVDSVVVSVVVDSVVVDSVVVSVVVDSVVVDPVEDDDVSPYTVRTDANGNPYDLGGMEVIIRDWWSGDPAEPSNAYEEELDAFRTWMQETYKFTLSQKAISDWGSTPEDFWSYVVTGGDENNYVFMQRPCTDLTNAMRQGLMKDLSKLDEALTQAKEIVLSIVK